MEFVDGIPVRKGELQEQHIKHECNYQSMKNELERPIKYEK